jgi:hypothetical protein
MVCFPMCFLWAFLPALAPVIAPSTRRLTGGLFDYEDLGAIGIKGLEMPVEAARVLRESGTESRFEVLRTARTPLVGREKELDLLLRRWRRVVLGEGQVVLISGEPGIGKSRLSAALREELEGEQHRRLRYFCYPIIRAARCIPLLVSSNVPPISSAKIRQKQSSISSKRSWP